MIEPASCWCGNVELVEWNSDYVRCPRCETLARRRAPALDLARAVNDDAGFYGREYWFSHQEQELGCPNIMHRTRADLPERCLHWMRTALRYKLPPARALELGSGPGGFVAILGWAGFDAMGLELSPWVVQFVKDTFDVPMLLGPIEDQTIEPASLDLIAAMDVLEHLPDPVGTMRHCLGLLKPDGIFLIQTPRYVEGRSHAEMVANGDRFLEMLRPKDHLHLFSHQSIRELFRRIGAEQVIFEPAVFAEYDTFTVTSRLKPVLHNPAEVDAALSAQPRGRMVQALLDLDADRDGLRRRHAEAEADRAARLKVLEAQGQRLAEAEAERNELRAHGDALRRHLTVAESDRAARLRIIETQGLRLGEVEGERNDLRAEVSALRQHLDAAERDRAARLQVIEEQAGRLSETESRLSETESNVSRLQSELTAQQDHLHVVAGHLGALQALISKIRRTRTYRLLRWLGRWKWLEPGVDPPQIPISPGVRPTESSGHRSAPGDYISVPDRDEMRR